MSGVFTEEWSSHVILCWRIWCLLHLRIIKRRILIREQHIFINWTHFRQGRFNRKWWINENQSFFCSDHLHYLSDEGKYYSAASWLWWVQHCSTIHMRRLLHIRGLHHLWWSSDRRLHLWCHDSDHPWQPRSSCHLWIQHRLAVFSRYDSLITWLYQVSTCLLTPVKSATKSCSIWDWDSPLYQPGKKVFNFSKLNIFSPTGNRTRAFHVTGGDPYH